MPKCTQKCQQKNIWGAWEANYIKNENQMIKKLNNTDKSRTTPRQLFSINNFGITPYSNWRLTGPQRSIPHDITHSTGGSGFTGENILVYSIYMILKKHHDTCIIIYQIKTVSRMNLSNDSLKSSKTLLNLPKFVSVPLEDEHSCKLHFIKL